ncbi:MAG: ABC transporter permease, partial [Cellulomonas sp.]|nr:ABC transporter permease [Cellulomonas sp.]
VGIAALSLGVGALMRHTAGAIAALMGFLLVIQTVFAAIPWKPRQIISPWLPGTAGQQIMATDSSIATMQAVPDHVGAVLDPWVGFAVLVAWAVLALVAAVVVLRSRDA